MWLRYLQTADGRLRPIFARLFCRFYGPFLGAGIRATHISADYTFMRVELPLTWYNRNYVGTQFGGSIYAMTDPFYMLMLIQILGRDYIVWDKGAVIDFIKPGRRRLTVDFRWQAGELDTIRARTAGGEKYLLDKEVLIHDSDGLLVARVVKTLYVRRRQPKDPQ